MGGSMITVIIKALVISIVAQYPNERIIEIEENTSDKQETTVTDIARKLL